MACIAACWRVYEISNPAVVTRDARLIAVLVAGYATEIREIGLINVAVCARRPNALVMCSRIDWEPGMVKCRAGPGCCCVALCAVRRESGRNMVWIRGACEIGLMASVAVGWERRVVVANVARSALHCGVSAG